MTIEIVNVQGYTTKLNPMPAKTISQGTAKVEFYKDEQNAYIGKYPRKRSAKDIFGTTQTIYSPTFFSQHLNEISVASALCELIAASLAEKIFKDFLVVPEHYLYINEADHPLILSRFIEFNEFLTKKEITQNKTKPQDWIQLPNRAALELTVSEANVLGKLFVIALLFNHWDVVNNINLSNSGYQMDPQGNFIPAIVDWGNALDQGFKGLTSDENCALNPEFSQSDSSNEPSIIGYQNCLPFDKAIFPKLPRQIIANLFDMEHSDVISKAVLSGAKQALTKAKQSLQCEQLDLQSIIDGCITKVSSAGSRWSRKKIKKTLNQDMYFPDNKHTGKDTLVSILEGRLKSLEGMFNKIDAGVSLDVYGDEVMEKYRNAQKYSGIRKNETF